MVLIASRFFHFSSEIDGPHVWRQSETAQYIHSFVNEGINILQPSVCWMGGHKTLLLEFPLPEAAIAILYHLLGNHLWIARLFFLCFFSISVYYLYQSLKLVVKNRVPEIATIIYCVLPLSWFYSRAIHIDFFAVAFAHGMLFYYLKALLEEKPFYWFMGTIMAIVAFVIKAPYAFYLALPVICLAFQSKKVVYLLKNCWWTLIPILAVLAWNYYSKTTNALAPDWDFIPNYNKFTDMGYWYFGTWYQRSLPELWLQIGARIINEVTGFFGIFLTLVGLIGYPKNKSYFWGVSWLLGTIAYLLIFYNLNVVHNYYQIPFLAPFAIFMAMGVYALTLKVKINTLTKSIGVIAVIIVFTESYLYAEKQYYITPYDQIEIGKVIRENSQPNDLVVVSYGGFSPQCPNLLFQAKRYGWSIPIHHINPQLYYKLYKKGKASKMVIVQPTKLAGEMEVFYQAMSNPKQVELKEYQLTVYIADLAFEK